MIMIKKIKKFVKCKRLYISKLLIVAAICGTMFIGPAIFTLVYYIQSNKFHEEALQELIAEGGLGRAGSNFIPFGDK
jgi:hypothetical protein